MQISRFSNGGFVRHKIPYGNGKLSAWFDDSGNVVDIEKFDSIGRSCSTGMEAAKEWALKFGNIYKGKGVV